MKCGISNSEAFEQQLASMEHFANASDEELDGVISSILKTEQSEVVRAIVSVHDNVRLIYKSLAKAMKQTKLPTRTTNRREQLALCGTAMEFIRMSHKFTLSELNEIYLSYMCEIDRDFPAINGE